MPKLSIILTPTDLKKFDVSLKTTVLIDALRASTTIITALARGANSVIPCSCFTSASSLYNSYSKMSDNYLLAGEKGGKAFSSSDLGNSPLEFVPEKIKNKNIILKTSNGTVALDKLKNKNAGKIYIGAMINSKFLVEHLIKREEDIFLLCAGHNGSFSLEDFLTAGRISYLLRHKGWEGDDLTTAAVRIYCDNNQYKDIVKLFYHSYNGQNLLGLGYKADIKFAAHVDIFKEIPYLNENNKIVSSVNT